MTAASLDLGPPAQWADFAGPVAGAITELAHGVVLAGAVLLAALTVLMLHAVLSGPRPVRQRRWLLGGGVILPAAAVGALLLYAFVVGAARPVMPPLEPVQIEVIGRQWWWEVRYTGADGETRIALANEVHVPVGRPVALQLSSADVLHGFWVPALTGKVGMVPGRRRHLSFMADRAGVFRGQCADYCGTQHARMGLQVIAQEEDAFRAWLARQAAPAIPPVDPFLREGRDVFMHAGCSGCHTVRGTEAQGEIGPDLTHVGSRRTLAAGTLANDSSRLAEWIAHSQQIKPGNLMPSMTQLRQRELRALAAYLASLQ
jgi:cytochrome c oxidase subunit 2